MTAEQVLDNTVVEHPELKKLETKQQEKNYFETLTSIDVSNYIEKKSGYSYLSWPYAVDQLKRRHPNAEINVKRFPDPDMNGLMVPYNKTSLGYFVEVEVIVDGVSVSEPFPVLDHRNKPMAQPTVFDINKAIQRAKVKSIAGHGLGLYIYAGEDLPMDSDDLQQSSNKQQQSQTSRQPAAPIQNPHVMTDMQKMQLRDLATNIAALRLGPGATQEQISQGIKSVYTEFALTANLTPELAQTKINELANYLNSLHTQMSQAQPQTNQQVAAEGFFG